MDHTPKKSRAVLFRFIGWFFLVNTLMSLLIGINYLSLLPNFSLVAETTWQSQIAAWFFLVNGFIAEVTLLFFSAALVTLVIASLLPRRWLVFSISMILTTILMFGLIGDSIAFRLYQMHYAGVALNILKAGAMSQVILLSLPEGLFILGLCSLLLILEYVIARLVWRQMLKKQKGSSGFIYAGALIISIGVAYGMMAIASNSDGRLRFSPGTSHVILKGARIIPYFNEIYQTVLPIDSSVYQLQTTEGMVPYQIQQANLPLQYPLHPLRCEPPKKKWNIVVIGVDTWRFDALTPKIMPNSYQFSKKTLQFNNHWSGGNCTEPGLFSLFYGIPATYWRAALAQHQGSILVHQLLQSGYQVKVFTSAPLNFPAFDKTIFREVPNLTIKTEGKNSLVRDRTITKAFTKFLNHRNQAEPFFSFLFYDAAHNYCETTKAYEGPFKPAVAACDRFSLTVNSDPLPYLNRYYNAVHFIDGQIERVLTELKNKNLLNNTIIILTADHGEEINDHRSGYWEHASAYTPYQLHVPMLIYWPGKNAAQFNYFTTHHDVVPTLMTTIFSCQNKTNDYSTGISLFSKEARSDLIAGSYADYAIVTPTGAIRIYPDGDYRVDDPDGRPMPAASIPMAPLKQAFTKVTQYFESPP